MSSDQIEGVVVPPIFSCTSMIIISPYTYELPHLFFKLGSQHWRLTYRPGWVHTGMTGAGSGKSKPAGAWTPEQTVDYMVDRVFTQGDFYVICPDNDTTPVSLSTWSSGG